MKGLATSEVTALDAGGPGVVPALGSVRFTGDRGIVLPLEVNARDGEITLAELCALLFELRVQIIERHEARVDAGVHFRLLVVEFDGGQLSRRRRHAVASAILALLDGAGPRARPRRAALAALPNH